MTKSTPASKGYMIQPGRRMKEAVDAIGPLGYLFGSASTARMLHVFTATPESHFTLGELQRRSGVAKGTAQVDVRKLVDARLVRREGQGPKTWYRYALDEDLGQEMPRVVRVSRRQMPHQQEQADIPWLAGLAGERPTASWNPFGNREEDIPSDEVTWKVLVASESTPKTQQPRALPGLRTRR